MKRGGPHVLALDLHHVVVPGDLARAQPVPGDRAPTGVSRATNRLVVRPEPNYGRAVLEQRRYDHFASLAVVDWSAAIAIQDLADDVRVGVVENARFPIGCGT